MKSLLDNPNLHIEEFLKYYFELRNPPHYAVLLKGKWGVGKTKFLKDFLDGLNNPDYAVKTHLYVSLYGITQVNQIETELFRQLHPFLSSKGMELAKKFGKGFLKATIKVDLDDDDKSDGSVSLQVPDIKLSDYLSNTNGFVLVFDDLERASMDIEALLGYINYYVEHQDYKVIIVANEEELLKNKKEDESFDIDVGYRLIKEKLIGKTFEIQPRLELAIQNFIAEVDNEDTKNFFNNNFDLIDDLYRRSSYWNLRHLRQALIDFARLLDVISEEVKENEDAIKHLLSIYLILSFEIKSGSMLPKEIKEMEGAYLSKLVSRATENKNDENKHQEFYQKIKKKYPSFNSMDMLLDKALWVDIFGKGLIEKDKIEESLSNSRYYQDKNQPDWIQLWHYLYLDDHEFEKILDRVQSDFQNFALNNINIIKHITGLFLKFSEEGLINMTKEDVMRIAKANIDSMVSSGIVLNSNIDFFTNTSSYGLGYTNINDENFNELIDYIKLQSKKQLEASLPSLANKLIIDAKNGSDQFYNKVASINHPEFKQYKKVPVLKYIKPEDFLDVIISCAPRDRIKIITAVSARYKTLIDIKSLIPEIAWLQKVVYLLEQELIDRKGTVMGIQIKLLIDSYLKDSISIFKVLPNV